MRTLVVCPVNDWPEANPDFLPDAWKVSFALGAMASNLDEDPFSDDEPFKYSYASGAFRDGYYQRSEFAALIARMIACRAGGNNQNVPQNLTFAVTTSGPLD